MRCVPVMLALALLVGAAAAAADSADEGPERILVTLSDPGMSNAARPGPVRPGYGRRSSPYLVSLTVKRAARRIARDFDLRMVDDWPILPLKVYCQVYAVGGNDSVEELLDRLRARPEVESAQRLNRFEVTGTPGVAAADPYAGLQHNLETLELAQAHAWSRGDGVRISIIDTGADLMHPDLRTQIASYRDFVTSDGAGFSADAHGTAVAGVIGASSDNGIGIVGIAPSATVSVLKACWYVSGRPRAICDSFTLAKALAYAVESAADVINLSFGGPPDPLLGRLVGLALERNIVVVAAAPAAGAAGFPSGVPGVIVVAADGSPDAATVPTPVNAPGDEILVPVPGGGFDYASGSSLSAAHVSGIAALLVARQPRLGGSDVAELLVASRPAAGRSVNACRALARLLDATGCRDDPATARAR